MHCRRCGVARGAVSTVSQESDEEAGIAGGGVWPDGLEGALSSFNAPPAAAPHVLCFPDSFASAAVGDAEVPEEDDEGPLTPDGWGA